jgi:hypothetical protein
MLAYTLFVSADSGLIFFAAALTQVFAQRSTVSQSHQISTWSVQKKLRLLNTSRMERT